MKINYPLLLDGGLSNELESQGCDLNNKLWSAKMLSEAPDKIVKAHLSYLKAGANCITTSSYQATIPGLIKAGYDRSSAESLILSTVILAEEAVKIYFLGEEDKVKPLIAASIGPYGAFLADGSEYHGNYGVTDAVLKEFHLSRIKLLDTTNADFFACETIPSLQETMVLSEILRETTKNTWISFSCKDEDHLNDGTPIEEAVKLLANHPKVFAIGVNCTPPQYISGLVDQIKKYSGSKKIIVYPNSGEVYNAKTKTWLGLSEPKSFLKMGKEWIDLGVDVLGGCCRIGPEHIKMLGKVLTKGNR